MEQVVRKLVTHIEYEPNWESGFLMQLWMMPVIEAMVSWCISDVSRFSPGGNLIYLRNMDW